MRMFYLILSILLILLFVNTCTERDKAVDSGGDFNSHFTHLQGAISGALIYSDSPFLVINHISIDSSKNLVIDPGVRIYFTDSSRITIRGSITAEGTEEYPIYFTAKNALWKGIKIINSTGQSTFKFCIIDKVFTTEEDSTEYGAMEVDNSSILVQNCIIRDNESENGAGIAVIQSNATISNNIFMNNQVLTFGGAIFNYQSNSRIINNTFYLNYSVNVGSAISLIDPVNDTVLNNIIYNNYSQQNYPQVFTRQQDSLRYSLSYNFISMDSPDPEFISQENLRLQSDSPCIDSGSPESKYNDRDGSRNDQGAYGGPDGNW